MNALSDDDMTIPSQKENTEEKILRSAFELYAQTDFKRFSLGNIAKRAGISKSAIFRYYKNKEALQNAMKCRFFDEFCNVLRKVTDASASKKDLFQNQLIDIITWFTVNKEYFCFFLTAIVVNPSPGEVLLSEIKKRDVVLFLGLYLNVTAVAEKKKKYLYRTGRYVSSAVLYFLLARISEPNRGEGDTASVDVFAQLFTDFLLKGWSQIDEISATRFAELDKLCETHTEEFPAENRIFCALAAVVKEYGYEGVTVERIAGELNMAKSSLYNYFGNKDELIKELVEDELILMSDFVYSMCNLTNNISEYVYMHMRSQIAYFLHRPFLLPVCYWLFLRGFKPEKFFLHEKLKKRKDFFRDIPMPNMGFPVTGFLLSGWFFLLAGFVMDLKHAGFFSDAEVIEYIKKYHYFIGRGLQSVFEQTEDNDAAL